MAYTVKRLSKISGVSVRTLHYYDEVGLLKPAYLGANGYRFYEEKQLLALQQILFYRELGFELKKIQQILGRGDFDKIKALCAHREFLEGNLSRTQILIQTIDKTIAHLKGKTKMKAQEMFSGFDAAKQEEHEQYLLERFGEPARKSIAQSKRRIKEWTKADWEKAGKQFDAICAELTTQLEAGAMADSREVQALIRRHFDWLSKFWMPKKESYSAHSKLILTSDLRKAYEEYHPKLAEFLAEGIGIFAESEL